MNQSGDYTRKQMAKDAEYVVVYREWVQSLPPGERAKLKQLGLDEPEVHRRGNGMQERDLGDSTLAREEATFVEEIDEAPPQAIVSTEGTEEKMLDMLRRLIAEVLSQSNTRLTLECLSLACGLTTLQGESMTSIAKRHGVTRAAVSKRCVDITEKLNLPPARSMRSKKARNTYRKAQIDTRKRNERIGN